MASMFEQADFSGGITDFIEKPSKQNQCAKADNLVFTQDRGLTLRPGVKAWNSNDYDLPFEPLGLWVMEGYLFAYCSDRYFYYTEEDASGTWTRLQGPVDDNEVTQYAGKIHASVWKSHLIITFEPDNKEPTQVNSDQVTFPPTYNRTPGRKIYIDAKTSTPKIVTLQLPKPQDAATSASNTGTTHLYNFKIGFVYDYYALVGGEVVRFTDFGPYELLSQTTGAEISGSDTITITWEAFANDNSHPSLSSYSSEHSSDELWDTANVKLYVCRTVDNGAAYYSIEEGDGYTIDQGDETYTLTLGDGFLTDNALCYDEGGALMYDTLPNGAFYNTIVDTRAWYGNLKDLSTRTYQAFSGNPAHTDSTVFNETDEAITGLSNFGNKPIEFSINKAARIEGSKNTLGQGRIIPRVISDSYGCISHASIVRTDKGVFYFSKVGICYTNAIRATIITDHLRDTYKDYTASQAQIDLVYGFYHVKKDLVFWRVKDSSDNYYFLVLDLRFGISSECSFTTMSFNYSVTNSIGPACVDTNDNILFATDDYILQLDDDQTYDVIPENAAVSGWESTSINYEFRSLAFNFGSSIAQKKSDFAVANFLDDQDLNGLSVEMLSYSDLSETPDYLDPCYYFQDFNSWGENEGQKWGNPDVLWNSTSVISFKRYFKGDETRSLYRQIGFQNLKIVVYDNDDYELANYIENTGNIEIELPNTASIASDVVIDKTWYFSTSVDGHKLKHEIISVSSSGGSTTISSNPDPDIDSGSVTIESVEWRIYRIKQDERITLLSYGLPYQIETDHDFGTYSTVDGADNGA